MRAVAIYKTLHVGDVEGHETDSKDQKRAQRHPDGSKTLLSVDVGQAGQYEDALDVAEAADEERKEEEHKGKLQSNWKQDLQLFRAEFFIACVALGRIGDVGVEKVEVLRDINHTAVRH